MSRSSRKPPAVAAGPRRSESDKTRRARASVVGEPGRDVRAGAGRLALPAAGVFVGRLAVEVVEALAFFALLVFLVFRACPRALVDRWVRARWCRRLVFLGEDF
jgi:hypothetical protein